jgi:CheY-like chemotaxis protein
MPHGGALVVETRVVELTAERARGIADGRAGRFAVLVVADTGHGMTRDVLERIFEPFFTTKEAAKGTGLGLSTIYGIVRQHGGFIQVESAPGAGTTFTVFLPFGQGGANRTRSSTPAPERKVAPARILVVEDDAQVLATVADVLRKDGHTVLVAHDAEAALAFLGDAQLPPDLLLADVVLPGVSGRDLHARLRAALPGLKVLFTSGYPGHGEDIIATLGPDAFIAKPFARKGLLRAVRQVLAGALGPETDEK